MIKDAFSGLEFETSLYSVSGNYLSEVTKKNGWLFNWKQEHKEVGRQVYSLTLIDSVTIQGLISLEIKTDHIYMHLLENAPHNRGKGKLYSDVAPNLVAYACQMSFSRGFEGNVSFIAKTKLIAHYENSLGAYHFKNGIMIIDTNAAIKLIDKHFKTP